MSDPAAPKTVKITIDGREITAEAGQTLLQVALDHGVEIPHYCYHPKLSIDGSCRMCQVKIEKAPKLAIACNTPVADGMMLPFGINTNPKRERGREFANGDQTNIGSLVRRIE